MGTSGSFGNLGTPDPKKTDIKQNEKHIMKTWEESELIWRLVLTGNYQLDLLRHGSSELVRSVASVFTIKLDEVLVVKHKSAVCVVCSVCRDAGRNEVFAIFCPCVSVEAKYKVQNVLGKWWKLWSFVTVHLNQLVFLSFLFFMTEMMLMLLTLAVGCPWLHTW